MSGLIRTDDPNSLYTPNKSAPWPCSKKESKGLVNAAKGALSKNVPPLRKITKQSKKMKGS